jgi:hypothetical protein
VTEADKEEKTDRKPTEHETSRSGADTAKSTYKNEELVKGSF